MATSLISTEVTLTPHSAVLRVMVVWSCSSSDLSIGHQLGEDASADHLAQRRLCDLGDGMPIVRDLQRSLLGILHHPEHYRVHVDRHGVLRQHALGLEFRGLDASIDVVGHAVDEGDEAEQTGFPHPHEKTRRNSRANPCEPSRQG